MKTSYSERPRIDWGEALAVPSFYGRQEEQTLLSQWVVRQDCRVVSVLGMGGIGKSALVVSVIHQLQETRRDTSLQPLPAVPMPCPFEVILFRSLRDAPSCEALLDDCLQVLSPQPLNTVPTTLEQRLSLLLSHLRKARVLIVLDNLECLLQDGNVRGHFRPGFEGYGLLLHRVVETVHQSCLLLTSREKPAELRLLEGRYPSVHSLRLARLDITACQQIFSEKELIGTKSEQEQLIEVYAGNPLALKIVTETIVGQFGGEIGRFLAGGPVIFGSITDLLSEQFTRLSALEQSVLCWLAIVREPATLDELLKLQVSDANPQQITQLRIRMLEAIDAGDRRSLIERGQRRGSFTLQSVVLEYVTTFLVTSGSREIQQHRLHRLIQHGLEPAHAKEYVRQTQERLLISPLLTELQNIYQSQADEAAHNRRDSAFEAAQDRRDSALCLSGGETNGHAVPTAPVEQQLLSLLDELRELTDPAQGYGPANLIALLRVLRGNLNGLDLSMLSIRGAYLQNVEMQDVLMAGARISDSVWTSAVSATWAVAMSFDGKWWAIGSMQGKMHVWEGVQSQTLRLSLSAHTDAVQALAFSPDGRTLASGSTDGTVKLWDLEACSRGASPRDTLLWTGWQYSPLSLAFTPDGTLLASAGMEATVQLWDPQNGMNLQTLTHPSPVFAVAFSPDGCLLASGCVDGEIRLWKRLHRSSEIFSLARSVQTNTGWVTSLTFAPDGRTLASTSLWDQTVKLWEVASGQLLHTLSGHANQSRCVAWSPDGCTLAYSNSDKAICVFDVDQCCYRAVLVGHTADIYGLAFTPDRRSLLSGSADGTLRMWDVQNRQCVRVIASYGISLWDLDWSPDGQHLISGGVDGLVTIWDLNGRTPFRGLCSHNWLVHGVGWSPNGRYVSSCGGEGVMLLWDPTSFSCVQRFEIPSTSFASMAWSPDANLLACGTHQRGIQVWDMTTRDLLYCVGQTYLTRCICLAWSPNGTQLVGGSSDGCICLWEGADGTLLAKLSGHHGWVRDVRWSPDGRWLASGGGIRESGELFVWDVERAVCVQTFAVSFGIVHALAWTPSGNQLVIGGSDGMLRWWDVQSGQCVRTQEAHQGTIQALKISPDGRRLASCGDDGAIMIWGVDSGEHLQTLRHDRPYERLNITGIRGLTEAEIASLRALGAIDEATPSLYQ